MSIKNYYNLTKPGIITGNLITLTAGFLFASQGFVDFRLLIATAAGLSLVIASGCVFNNYIDRGIDARMARTKKRELVTGKISVKNAIIFASVLGLSGFWLLLYYANILATSVAVIGFVTYVLIYGYAKRHSVHGTLVGSISGAVPPVIGYTAVTGVMDNAAWLVFLSMILWQMPHFYAISIYRLSEYKAAGLPVLPVKYGVQATKVQMLIYIIAWTVTASLLTIYDYASSFFAVVMIILGSLWLMLACGGFLRDDDTAWAKRMFGFSLVVILGWSIVLALDPMIKFVSWFWLFI